MSRRLTKIRVEGINRRVETFAETNLKILGVAAQNIFLELVKIEPDNLTVAVKQIVEPANGAVNAVGEIGGVELHENISAGTFMAGVGLHENFGLPAARREGNRAAQSFFVHNNQNQIDFVKAFLNRWVETPGGKLEAADKNRLAAGTLQILIAERNELNLVDKFQLVGTAGAKFVDDTGAKSSSASHDKFRLRLLKIIAANPRRDFD